MKISQREARRLKKRVLELESREESRRSRWAASYPGGTNFHQFKVDKESAAAIRVASVLQHAVVARIDGSDNLLFYALPQRSE